MIKKIFMALTLAICSFLSIFGVTTSTVHASEGAGTEVTQSETEERGLPTFVNTTAASLGLPSSLNYDWTRSGFNSSLTSYEVNGFVFTISGGEVTSVAVSSNAASYTAIGIIDKLGDMRVDQTLYYDLDYTQFTSAKTFVFEQTLNLSASSDVGSQLPVVENVIFMKRGYPPLFWSASSTARNFIFGCPYGDSTDPVWSDNRNFNLNTYPAGARFIAAESSKWSYGKNLESYKDSENYDGDEDLSLYVIPDDELKRLTTIDYSTYKYVEKGGVIWTRTIANMLDIGYAVAYIDPSVTKIVIDGDMMANNVHAPLGYQPDRKLNQIYCLEGSTGDALAYFNAVDAYVPTGGTFKYSNFEGIDNVYYYGDTSKTISITSSGIGSTVTPTTNFYLPNSTYTVENTSNNSAITQKFTNSYSKTFEPVVAIQVGSDVESTTDLTMTANELKQVLNARLATEATLREEASAFDALVVELLIASNLTLDDKADVVAARTAYNSLSDGAKEFVTKLSELEALEEKIENLEKAAAKEVEDKAKAASVDSIIDKLPTTITLDDKKAIEDARIAYDALTEDQKAYVENLDELVEAEETLAELEAIEAERIAEVKAKAAAVDTLIDAIPSKVTVENKEAIEAAREAYEELTDEEKTYVTKYAKLHKAELEIKRAEISEGKTAEEIKALEEKAAEVDKLIDAIPDKVTEKDKDKVKAARRAYNALTEDEKAFVDGLLELEEAEQALKDLGVEDTFFEKIKDKISESKALKAVTIVISIIFGLLLFYGIYVLIRYIVKWLK